jgi:hypothetical protein
MLSATHRLYCTRVYLPSRPRPADPAAQSCAKVLHRHYPQRDCAPARARDLAGCRQTPATQPGGMFASYCRQPPGATLPRAQGSGAALSAVRAERSTAGVGAPRVPVLSLCGGYREPKRRTRRVGPWGLAAGTRWNVTLRYHACRGRTAPEIVTRCLSCPRPAPSLALQ